MHLQHVLRREIGKTFGRRTDKHLVAPSFQDPWQQPDYRAASTLPAAARGWQHPQRGAAKAACSHGHGDLARRRVVWPPLSGRWHFIECGLTRLRDRRTLLATPTLEAIPWPNDCRPTPSTTRDDCQVARPATPPPQIIIQQSMFGRMGKLLLVLLGIMVVVIIGLVSSYRSYFNEPDKPQEKYHSLARHATQKIAIITSEGAIMEGDGFVKKQIDAVQGGSGRGGRRAADQFARRHGHRQRLSSITTCGNWSKSAKLPLVVSMGSLCASGGYYIAMAVGDEQDFDLCRADHLDRLDRRDHSALRSLRAARQLWTSKTIRSPAGRSRRWAASPSR